MSREEMIRGVRMLEDGSRQHAVSITLGTRRVLLVDFGHATASLAAWQSAMEDDLASPQADNTYQIMLDKSYNDRDHVGYEDSSLCWDVNKRSNP